MQDPAKNILKPGDYIVALNEKKISCKQDLINDLETIDGKPVTVSVRRNNSTIPVSLTPAQDASGKYKLGIWVRDDTQGIGTLTYVTKDGNFGALGHGISDIDTGNLLSIKGGNLYCAQILGVQKGEKGSPGELSGLIRYRNDNVIGQIRVIVQMEFTAVSPAVLAIILQSSRPQFLLQMTRSMLLKALTSPKLLSGILQTVFPKMILCQFPSAR